ncbi:succinyl-diaminopimelate desuccinylase [Halorhodospira halophila]|uniref:Succinyl-diaminopimelate desuccinylase n=1 Tax=Halorhodospira halophila (strain DSM 244 / SL1) TaxID=349124 RepID=DAPE_HALHL|nr:succinyl-diaminopimelate desuccinylase [Halorhodospira halophila]A1WX26.1 RecName: Full=Succinyl-diaminopimelate desuccinylase; Short=SDAP desuccinylase; AltName: Full=N-succinyl-LL-2,6-diaminoheptanedioate amidohydrolase [Halorhodospira halophila SL1]ABM62238.1 succinyldiaminopimelate desuccinylase [Halorhodospira halophila SL1]MBK1729213.1 succinyl-diaminopimelate desuccinylase [Halorhodospira halophila]
MSATLELARELIQRPSVTPEDAGCQTLVAERLAAAGFGAEWLNAAGVTNLWAQRGTERPLFCFLGHTDVVPSGPESAWQHPPFQPIVENGCLYGRGAADMKGSVAAFVAAVERFVARHPDHAGAIAVLLTSDEEGPAVDGTRRVVETLAARGAAIDYCLVGEPSSQARLGDEYKVGRRGSLTGHLTVHGEQGHVAYPHQADNPIHAFAPALQELVATEWDQGDADFPPTSFQISNIQAGTGADNVIPGAMEVVFNLRYAPAVSAEELQERIESILHRHGVHHTLHWRHSGAPFATREGALIDAVEQAVTAHTGQCPRRSTSGGTSDGRFMGPTGAQVVELGPLNATIHKANEHVAVADLEALEAIYFDILQHLLAPAD